MKGMFYRCNLLILILICLTLVPANSINAKRLKVTVSSRKVTVGNTVKIKANFKCTFKSSNKKVATVTSKGIVKAKKAGKVRITVISKSNKKVKKTLKLTVLNKKTVATTEAETTTESEKSTKATTESAKSTKATTESAKSTKATTESAKSTKTTTESIKSTEATTESAKKEPEVTSISAKYNGGALSIYSTVDFNLLDVVATFSDGTSRNLNYGEYEFTTNTYSISPGEIPVGVSYKGKTASFNLTFREVPDDDLFSLIVTYDGSLSSFEEDKVNVVIMYPKRMIRPENPPYVYAGIYTKDGISSYCYTYYYSEDVEYNGETIHVFGYNSVLLPVK